MFQDEQDILISEMPEVPPVASDYQHAVPKFNLGGSEVLALVNFLGAIVPGIIERITFAAKMRGQAVYFDGPLAAEHFGNQRVHYVIRVVAGNNPEFLDAGILFDRMTAMNRESAANAVLGVVTDALGFGLDGKALMTREQVVCKLAGVEEFVDSLCRAWRSNLANSRRG